MSETKRIEKKSVFESRLLSTKIHSANVSLFPEAFFGYLAGPMFALIGNGVINAFLVQYWDRVLDLGTWAKVFEILLPILSSVVIILGNLFVGRLMSRKPTMAGKARPFILLCIPFLVVAMLMLFFPWTFPAKDASYGNSVATLLVVAIGYNLYYAFAWPFYFTPHSSLVTLSSRDSNARGLLATAVNAAQLGAAGLAGMFGGILTDALRLLPQEGHYVVNGKVLSDVAVYQSKGGQYGEYYAYYRQMVANPLFNHTENGKLVLNDGVTIQYSNAPWEARQDANSRWIIIMLVMVALLVIGCLLEYYFTRERITEEKAKLVREGVNVDDKKKAASMGEQVKVAVRDKYWWFVMIFFFLYQFGGMMKNNSSMWFSQSIDGGGTVSSIINTFGAIPTAVGMLLIFPLSKKFGKANCIKVGGLIAALFSLVGLAVIPMPAVTTADVSAISAVSTAAFCLKALGTVPAMYISMALLADVLDHEEAVYGIRTDGFTMSVYGSIMVAMTGITNGIIVGFNGIQGVDPKVMNTILFFLVEGAAYLIIAVMFLFMNVEKFSKLDHEQIVADEKAEVEKAGAVWIAPEERAKIEQAKIDEEVDRDRKEELKAKCEKKHLDYEKELAAYEKKEADKKALARNKEEAQKAREAAKKAAKEEKAKARFDALSAEQQKALKDKEAKKQALQAKKEADLRVEFAKIRANAEPLRAQLTSH